MAPLLALIDLKKQCPLSRGATLEELACIRFLQRPQLPYVIAVASGAISNSLHLYDAQKLQEHVQANSAILPIYKESIRKIHYFYLRRLNEGLLYLGTDGGMPNPFYQQFVLGASHRDHHEERVTVAEQLFKMQRWSECYSWTEMALGAVEDESSTQLLSLMEKLLEKKIEVLPHKKAFFLSQIVKKNPKNHKACFALGLLLHHGARDLKPDPEQAKQCFRQAQQECPAYEDELSELMRKIGLQARPKITEQQLFYGFLQQAPRELQPTTEELQGLLNLATLAPIAHPKQILALLDKILEANPSDPFALSRKGELLRQGAGVVVPKNVHDAYEVLNRAYKIISTDPFINCRLAYCLLERQELAGAEKLFKAAYDADPTSLVTLQGLATLYQDTQARIPLLSRRYLEEILTLQPANAAACTSLAILLSFGTESFAPDPAEATELFSRAYRHDKMNVKTLLGWAELLIKERRLAKAKELLTEAMALDGENPHVVSRMAEVLRLQADEIPVNLLISLQMFQAVVEKHKGYAYAEIRLGAIYLIGDKQMQPNMELAEKWLHEGYTHDREDPVGLSHYGELLRRKGDYLQARHFFELAYKKNSDDPLMLSGLGLIFRMGLGVEKDRHWGNQLLHRALNQAPNSPIIKARVEQPSLRDEREAKLDHQRAISLFREFVKLHPNEPRALVTLAEEIILDPKSEQHDVQEAAKHLARALQINKHDVEALYWLAELYLCRKDLYPNKLDEAINFLENASLLRKKSDCKILAKLGFALLKRANSHDIEAAKEHLKSAKTMLKTQIKKEQQKREKYELTLLLSMTYYHLGELYRTGGGSILANKNRASQLIKRALERNPENYHALVSKGHLLTQDQKPEEAEVCFKKAHELNPKDERVQQANYVEVPL